MSVDRFPSAWNRFAENNGQRGSDSLMFIALKVTDVVF